MASEGRQISDEERAQYKVSFFYKLIIVILFESIRKFKGQIIINRVV